MLNSSRVIQNSKCLPRSLSSVDIEKGAVPQVISERAVQVGFKANLTQAFDWVKNNRSKAAFLGICMASTASVLAMSSRTCNAIDNNRSPNNRSCHAYTNLLGQAPWLYMSGEMSAEMALLFKEIESKDQAFPFNETLPTVQKSPLAGEEPPLVAENPAEEMLVNRTSDHLKNNLTEHVRFVARSFAAKYPHLSLQKNQTDTARLDVLRQQGINPYEVLDYLPLNATV